MKQALTTLGFAFLIALPVVASKHARSSPVDAPIWIAWEEPESQTRLERARLKGDFFQLVNLFEPQKNKFSCGLASATILLNAFHLKDKAAPKPLDGADYPWSQNYFGPSFTPVFARFTQNTILGPRTDHVKTRETFFGEKDSAGKTDEGLQLEQLKGILETHGLHAVAHHVESEQAFDDQKKAILASLQDRTSFVVVNFHRKPLGQAGGGHLSPVAAYDETSDSFLVMDVNPVSSTWFWVSSPALFKAMNTQDSQAYRGFIVVSK